MVPGSGSRQTGGELIILGMPPPVTRRNHHDCYRGCLITSLSSDHHYRRLRWAPSTSRPRSRTICKWNSSRGLGHLSCLVTVNQIIRRHQTHGLRNFGGFSIGFSIDSERVCLARKRSINGEGTFPGHLDANKNHAKAGERPSKADSDRAHVSCLPCWF